jgi:hypothetical protein
MSDAIEYRPITGAPGYRIGSDGTPWSCRRKDGSFSDKWKPLSVHRRPYGGRYCVFCIRPERNGKVECRYVHITVLEEFVGPAPPDKPECRHLDNDTSHNWLSNLRWGTRQENIDDQLRFGTRPVGTKRCNAKLDDLTVVEVKKLLKQGFRPHSIIKMLGLSINPGTILNIERGKSWKHITTDAVS